MRIGGAPHNFTNSKHLALLAYLVMEPGEHRREQLTRFVWSAGSSGSIDTALSELRAVFGPEVIPPRARKIGIAPGLVELDALRLLSALADSGSRADAIDLYRGPFLEGFKTRGSAESFVRWIEKTRVKLDEAFRRLCDEECREAAVAGRWERVLSVVELGMRGSPGWAAGEEWREAAGRALQAGSARDRDTEGRRVPGEDAGPGAGEPDTEERPPAGEGVRREPAAAPVIEPDPREADPAAHDVRVRPAIPPPPPRVRWMRPALAGAATALLVAVAILLFARWRNDGSLAQMPLMRADELPAPGSPVRQLSDWLITDGRWIYYRYERYMPGACARPPRSGTMAVGNFGRGGWTLGPRVVCLNAAWLAVDGERLVQRFRLAPETTYCLQFLYREDGRAFWGQHGNEDAPGLDSIRVVAPAGQHNIGFAILRRGPGERRIELTHRFPGSDC